MNRWRALLPAGAAHVSGAEPAAAKLTVDTTVPHAKIGELTLANDFRPIRFEKADPLPSAKR